MAIVTTTAVWNPLLNSTDDATVQAKALQMYQAGQATSEFGQTSPNPGGIANNVAPMTVVRSWTSQSAAEEWVAYLTPYGPQSIVINS
jgi:hypothetical protein